jgi:hypothetical protein
MKYKIIIKLAECPQCYCGEIQQIKLRKNKKKYSVGKNMKNITGAKDSEASPTACPILLSSFNFTWCTLFSVTRLWQLLCMLIFML